MSKSFRKTPAIKNNDSNKADKQLANRKFRRISKYKIQARDYEKLPTDLDDTSDVWEFNSDGLALYDENLPNKYMRK